MPAITAVRTPSPTKRANAISLRRVTVDQIRHTAALRCAYPSKVCTNARALKISGELHRLCEFHRRKANMNQQRLQQRRRMVRAEQEAQSFRPAQQSPLSAVLALERNDCRDEQSLNCKSEPHTEHDLTRASASAFSTLLDASKQSCSLSMLFADVGHAATDLPMLDASAVVVSSQDYELLQSILFGEPIIGAFDGTGTCSVDDILGSSNNVGVDEAKLRFAEMEVLDFSV